jgi:hypothetical protein
VSPGSGPPNLSTRDPDLAKELIMVDDREAKSFDVKTIVDFYKTLMLSIYEQATLVGQTGEMNPDREKELSELRLKYGLSTVLPAYSITRDEEDHTGKQFAKAKRLFRTRMLKELKKQATNLANTFCMFAMALAHVSGELDHVRVPVSKILDGSYFKEMWDWKKITSQPRSTPPESDI